MKFGLDAGIADQRVIMPSYDGGRSIRDR